MIYYSLVNAFVFSFLIRYIEVLKVTNLHLTAMSFHQENFELCELYKQVMWQFIIEPEKYRLVYKLKQTLITSLHLHFIINLSTFWLFNVNTTIIK